MSGSRSFDLVVTTLGRTSEPARLLESLAAQTHHRFRVIIVDQNDDGRLDEVLSREWSFPLLRLTSDIGASRGRNRGIVEVDADVVGFPDDDCRYPPELLEQVAATLAARPQLDGVTGRIVGFDRVLEPGAWRDEPGLLTLDNVWSSGVCATIFLRAELVRGIGALDTRLGLGSDAGVRSGEETDYLVRAVVQGGRIHYDPELLVEHAAAPEAIRFSRARGFRDGLSLGYILRKNPVPARVVVRMLVRPLGGIVVRLVERDLTGARFQAATLAGRVRGLLTSPGGRPGERRPAA